MNKPITKLLLLIFVMYVLTLKGLVGNLLPNGIGPNKITFDVPPFETSMERGRYAQVVALADYHTVDLTMYSTFLQPDVAWYNNRFFSTFPIGTAVIAVPFYLVGKLVGLSQVFTFLTSAIFTLLTVYLIYQLCQKLGVSENSALLAATVYGLASVAWPYSVSFSAHAVSAFTTALACWFLVSREKPFWPFFLIGLSWGSGFFIDYPNLAIIFPLIFSIFVLDIFSLTKTEDYMDFEVKNPKAFLGLLMGFGIMFVLFAWYNIHFYGKPIAFANTYSIKFLETSGVDFEKIKLSADIFDGHAYASRFSFGHVLEGVKTLMVSHDRGLFFFSPVFLLSLIGVIVFFRKNSRFVLIFGALFLTDLLLYASYDDPWGGWAFGPRYLIVTMPVLCLFIGFGYDWLLNKFGVLTKLIVFLLLAFSSGVALLGALTTNAVPPSIEASALGYGDNFLNNWHYLVYQHTSSFVYSLGLSQWISPLIYGVILYLLLEVSLILLLFI